MDLFLGGLIHEENNQKFIIGVLSAGGVRCYSHFQSLFAFVPPNVEWIRGHLDQDVLDRENQS
jgi:hypothetical protein